MNIFILDKDPATAAIMMCDKHVPKMILESAQMLSTAHRILDTDVDDRLYKIAHKGHPCTKWVMETSQNYNWLYYHFVALGNEYKFRRNKVHGSIEKLQDPLSNLPKNIPEGPRTEFVQAMKAYPQCMVEGDAVQSYRNYYHEAKDFAKWEWGREAPYWWKGYSGA